MTVTNERKEKKRLAKQILTGFIQTNNIIKGITESVRTVQKKITLGVCVCVHCYNLVNACEILP